MSSGSWLIITITRYIATKAAVRRYILHIPMYKYTGTSALC